MDKTIFLCNEKNNVKRIYTKEQISDNQIYDYNQLISNNYNTKDVEYVFSTWGMPALTRNEIKEFLPNLKAVFYGAGSVQYFAKPFLEEGVKIFSAFAANAVPVAEFTVAQIILANKGFFQMHNKYKESYEKCKEYSFKYPGNYGCTVGIIGAGVIGKLVINMLKTYQLKVKVFDPFLSDEDAKLLGVEKTSLEDLFHTCQTISNHLANNENTKAMLDYNLFSKMNNYATFINTGRGAQINLEGFIKAMEEKPDCTAVLDVVDPFEPLDSDNKLLKMHNVFISPHIAGSYGDELLRMGQYMCLEYGKFIKGEKCLYQVKMEMLETMA